MTDISATDEVSGDSEIGIVTSISEYVQVIDDLVCLSDGVVLFRGQAKQGGLIPGVARNASIEDTTQLEMWMLQELQRMGAAYEGLKVNSQWELLTVAQHFGMKTRLLDWTQNPFAALWFACTSNRRGNVNVYVYEPDKEAIIDPEKESPFGQEEIKVYKPMWNNERIMSQLGWFTVHPYSSEQSKFLSLTKKGVGKGELNRVET